MQGERAAAGLAGCAESGLVDAEVSFGIQDSISTTDTRKKENQGNGGQSEQKNGEV